jgi:hypothetical protein
MAVNGNSDIAQIAEVGNPTGMTSNHNDGGYMT